MIEYGGRREHRLPHTRRVEAAEAGQARWPLSRAWADGDTHAIVRRRWPVTQSLCVPWSRAPGVGFSAEWLAKYERAWNSRLDRVEDYLKELQQQGERQ
ncbi:MAG TPA: hypothetical protein VGJ50_16535 [Streptosporangiaceae bacterium]